MSVRCSQIRLCVNANTQIAARHSIDPLTLHLPAEVVSEIFVFTLSSPTPLSYSTFSLVQQENVNGAPLKLGAVCRAWRAIAWATPQLWTHLYLHIDLIASHRYDNSALNASLQFANAWLSRSGRLPLSLQIHVRFDAPPRPRASEVDHRSVPLLSSLFREYGPRWRALDVWCPDWYLAALFPTVAGAASTVTATTLDSLRIHAMYDPYHPTRAIFSGYGVLAPAPRWISISGGTLRFADVRIGWQNATRVDMEGIDLAGCVYILTHALGLEDVRFSRVVVNEADAHTTNAVSIEGQTHTTLTFLKSLHLDFPSSFLPSHNPLDALLSVITAPALSSLSLSLGTLPSRALLPTIAFIHRSGCAISSLAVSRRYAGARDDEQGGDEHAQLLALLRATPDLRHLDVGVKFGLGDPHPQARLMKMLAGNAEQAEGGERQGELALPRLKTLHIGIGRIHRVNGVRLFDWTSIPRLMDSGRLSWKMLRISWVWDGVSSEGTQAAPYWDRETVVSVMELQRWHGRNGPCENKNGTDSWIELDTRDTKGEVDLFEASVDFHGLRG